MYTQLNGSEIELLNTGDRTINELTIEGKSEQISREEVNIIDPLAYIKAGAQSTIGGITYTVLEDGRINVNGTAAERSVFVIAPDTNIPLKDGIKTISGGGANIAFQLAINDNGTNVYPTVYGSSSSRNYTNATIRAIVLVVAEGKTINNEIIYLQFQEGATATPWQRRISGRYGNICPPTNDSRWVFENGAYLDEKGNIVLPNLSSDAYIVVPWNKRHNYAQVVYTLVSGGNAHIQTAYLDANKAMLQGNGSAIKDKEDGYSHIGLFGGANIYGEAIAEAEYISLKFIRSSDFAPNEYKVNNIAISVDDDLFTEYNPVTPTPNDPSEIKSVGYKNLFDGKFRQGSEGTTENLQNIFSASDLVLSPGSYTFSCDLPMGSYKYAIGTSQTAFPSTATYIGGFQYTKSHTFTLNKPLHIGVLINGNGVDITPDDIKNYHFQITKGTQQHSYIPHGKYGIEVKTISKNLFDINTIHKDNNATSTITNNTLKIVTSGAYGGTDYTNIQIPNNTYTISFDWESDTELSGTDARIYVYDGATVGTMLTYSNLVGVSGKVSLTFTNTTGAISIRFSPNNTGTAKTIRMNLINIQLEEDAEASEYQPYQKDITVFKLNEPPRSLPNGVKDNLRIHNGKIYVERNVGVTILNGTETWYSYLTGSADGYTYYTPIDKSALGLNVSLCSHFKNVSYAWDVGGIGDFSDHPSLTYKYFTTSQPTISDFKNWLSQNNVEVQYPLQTPYIEELTTITKPVTFEGTTYITTTDPLKPNITLEYFKGFSDEDKQAIKDGTVAIKSRIIVNTEPQMVLTENDSIKDWEYYDERYVPQQGFIGQFVARTLSGNLQDISDEFNIENHEIELQLGIVNIGSGGETWYSFGKFLVTSPEGDEVTDNTKFEAMDYTKKFNVDFDGNYTSENFPESYNTIVAVDETTGEPKGSVTALWLARYTCEQAGVEFGQNTFTNADYEINFNPYQAGETCRDVMKDVAKLAFSWVRVDVDNKCYIDFKETKATYEDEYNVFTNNEYYSLETKKEIYGPINRIYIGMSNIDGESIIVAEDKEDIEANGEKALYIYDNQLTYSPELRALIADNYSANKLLGLTYTHLTTETIGHPWLNGKEFISVIGMEDNECKTYPFNRIIKFNGHIKSTLDSMGESEVEATLGYESEVVKNAKNAMVLVKKHEGEIELLTTDVTNVQDNIKDNYYTKEDTNKTILNATSGLTNIYTSAGGNNRFRNTGLHFKEADGFEYWNGLVEVITEINSATQTAMLLQNGSVSQIVSNLPNGKYTISFKYEELIESSSTYVLINSTRYDLAGSGAFKQTIDVNTNNIEIDFNCDTNGGFKIYELMGNVGETALVWTQHPDEIMTDTVNISKGITITSSSKKNVVFKAGADGIKIENKSKNTTTEFLENGMSTNDAEIKGQAKISGSLFTKVGNQTWISGL